MHTHTHVPVHTNTHMCMCAHKHTYINMHTGVPVHTNTHTHKHAHMCTCTHKHTHRYKHIHMCTCTHICTHNIYKSLNHTHSMYACMHTHTQTHTHTTKFSSVLRDDLLHTFYRKLGAHEYVVFRTLHFWGTCLYLGVLSMDMGEVSRVREYMVHVCFCNQLTLYKTYSFTENLASQS